LITKIGLQKLKIQTKISVKTVAKKSLCYIRKLNFLQTKLSYLENILLDILFQPKNILYIKSFNFGKKYEGQLIK